MTEPQRSRGGELMDRRVQLTALHDEVNSSYPFAVTGDDANHVMFMLGRALSLAMLFSEDVDQLKMQLDECREGLALIAEDDELAEESAAFGLHAYRHRQAQARVLLHLLNGNGGDVELGDDQGDVTRKLHSTTDAMTWAREFVRLFPEGTGDVGTMVGWFANAIEVGRAAGESAETPAGGDRVGG